MCMHHKTINWIQFSLDSKNYQGLGLCCSPWPLALANNTNLPLGNSYYHAQPRPIITQAVQPGFKFFFILFFLFFPHSVTNYSLGSKAHASQTFE